MANISDIIEGFLIEILGDNNSVNISRNELAHYFSCAPSQINYVLTTRFTPARGYIIESRRGGGGFVNVIKLENSEDNLLGSLVDIPINEGLSLTQAFQILERLVENGLLTENEGILLGSVMGDKALVSPSISKDGLRAGMIRSLAAALMKKKGDGRQSDGGQ